VDGDRVKAASRDPGRLRELLRPGVELRLERATGGGRKTGYTLTLVRHRGVWVSLIPSLANDILDAALRRRQVPGLPASVVRREVALGRHRLDFQLELGGETVLAEVKSATLVRSGKALFPDAPTTRGARHLEALARHQKNGGRGLVVFLVQRRDALSFAPNEEADPAFARALREAVRAGVAVRCYRCAVSPRGCTLLGPIPFESGGDDQED
jgi:sugar fermentation stimulation protein A